MSELLDPLPWVKRPAHRRWLEQQADQLFTFFGAHTIDPAGGFFEMDVTGAVKRGKNAPRGVHMSARQVHCSVAGHLMGRPGLSDMIDHGMTSIWNRHRDTAQGGYFWAIDDNGPADSTKQGYGHAFVLLAASSASLVGHPLAKEMLADVTDILNTRFWEEKHGAITEEFTASVKTIDVDENPALLERYDELVPVLLHGETELCHHFLNAAKVREYLALK